MILYSVAPRVNPQDPEADPVFKATAQSMKSLDINEFAEHISTHNSVYSRDVIQGVLVKSVDCMRELLLDGARIHLGDLGTFFVTLSGDGSKTREDYTPAKIKRVNVKWRPGNRFKGLISEAKFEKVSTRIAQSSILNAETAGNASVNLGDIKKEIADKRK